MSIQGKHSQRRRSEREKKSKPPRRRRNLTDATSRRICTPRIVTDESEFKRSMCKMFRENKREKNVQRSKGKIRNSKAKKEGMVNLKKEPSF